MKGDQLAMVLHEVLTGQTVDVVGIGLRGRRIHSECSRDGRKLFVASWLENRVVVK